MAKQLTDKIYVQGGYLDSLVTISSVDELIDKIDFIGQSVHMPEAFTNADGMISYPIDFWIIPSTNEDGVKWEIKKVPTIENDSDFMLFKAFCTDFQNKLGYYPMSNGGTVLVNGENYALSLTENGAEWVSVQGNLDDTITDAVELAVEDAVKAVTSGASEAFDTLKEIEDWINANSGTTGMQGPQGAEGAQGPQGEKGAIDEAAVASIKEDIYNSGVSYTDSVISALVGEDKEKTIRTIAAEEIASQLIADDAVESLDTLEEIAAWIQSHPDDAATMNAKILALEASAHTHENKETLDGITNERVFAWDAAEQNAKDYTDSQLSNYATKSYVTEQVVSAMTGGQIELDGYAKEEDVKTWDLYTLVSAYTYTDTVESKIDEKLNWLPVDGDTEAHKVRHWRGNRAKYELLVKNNSTSPYTRYVVIDEINGEEVITEYFGTNQIYDLSGQLLPVNSIISDINEVTAEPYKRYLVGQDGVGYSVYECVLDEENVLKWKIRTFDYRFGVRVIDKGLKNYVYIENILKTYDDVDCGTF